MFKLDIVFRGAQGEIKYTHKCKDYDRALETLGAYLTRHGETFAWNIS